MCTELTLNKSSSESEYYSSEEVLNLIRNLSEVEFLKLRKMVDFIAWEYNFEKDELMQTVIDKIISGDRNWPSGLNFLVFAKVTLKSIASNYVKKSKPRKEDISLNKINEMGYEMIESFETAQNEIVEDLFTTEIRTKIVDLFSDDITLKYMVEGRLDNLKRGEIMKLLELSPKEYDAKYKAIRRRIEKSNLRGDLI